VRLEVVNPASLGAPKGWNHGVLAPHGTRLLFVAGMAGWSEGQPGEPPGFVEQFARALDQLLAVVREAGGEASQVARMTVYVTDLAEYRAARPALGGVWRERFGRHYPAMALLEVKGLVDLGAKVEIEATAVLAGGTEP
jgi:enamine deaminase RidA (YjgF/YER057c/UK114 family)